MSFIKWKNINSDDIKGLLICELPPISKPKMKTSITEIDGKDGDTIECLGYKSYTKTIKIGLTRNYDINEIIEYFNGAGELILSNEPDKYYIAQIVDSVDYEKLINFKTASVKYHVQPFKYLVNEAPFVLNVSNETELKVSNVGFQQSKPIITIYGTGIVELKINNKHYCTLDFDSEFITINSMLEEAYYKDLLKNRRMKGDFPILKTGINIISWSGNVSKIIVEPKSRWL